MTGHEITEVIPAAHTVTVVCACGKQYKAPNEDTARRRHGVHLSIVDARAALEQGEGTSGA